MSPGPKSWVVPSGATTPSVRRWSATAARAHSARAAWRDCRAAQVQARGLILASFEWFLDRGTGGLVKNGTRFTQSLQRLPVDACDHAGVIRGSAGRRAQARVDQRLGRAGDRGEQRLAVARRRSRCATSHAARRNRSGSDSCRRPRRTARRGRPCARSDAAPTRSARRRGAQQVVVVLAEGVADLAQHARSAPSRSWQTQKLTGLNT